MGGQISGLREYILGQTRRISGLRGYILGLTGQISGNERADIRPERLDGGMDGRTDRKMDKWTNESPLVFYKTLSLLGPLPKNQHS